MAVNNYKQPSLSVILKGSVFKYCSSVKSLIMAPTQDLSGVD